MDEVEVAEPNMTDIATPIIADNCDIKVSYDSDITVQDDSDIIIHDDSDMLVIEDEVDLRHNDPNTRIDTDEQVVNVDFQAMLARMRHGAAKEAS